MEYRGLSPEELVRACTSSSDVEAWGEFVNRFHKLVATVALRVARRFGETSRDVVDELVQETYLKLCTDDCRILRSFEPRHAGSFYGFLKVVTANVVRDHFRGERSAKRGGNNPTTMEALENATKVARKAESTFENADYRVLLRELDTSLKEVARGPDLDRDRRIFWLYYRVGLTAEAISALPSIGLGVKGVESTILRLNRALRERLVEARLRRAGPEGFGRSQSFF
jgi:RNA polymerase sigma-70 factor (ECF subfamily)